MKPLSHLRTHAGLQAFFPTTSKNVQEVEHTNPVTVVSTDTDGDAAYRPRLLSLRFARAARRQAH